MPKQQYLKARLPWALGLVTDRFPAAPPAWEKVVLDPQTQTARYSAADGGPVVTTAGHGTSRTSGTTSLSGGSDGKNPKPQTNDDNTVDYTSD
ncbi:putative ATP-grasp-modified RiPP [Streptomyces sp. CA-111067]|uniref:putative ATP-grasp-modified RiPP n=1 Tax=Streptomyces sp. CA-111067 TaxID=3240046 RepID=UPI003D993635